MFPSLPREASCSVEGRGDPTPGEHLALGAMVKMLIFILNYEYYDCDHYCHFDLTMYNRASLMAHLVKNPPAMQETPVQLLGRVDPLEKGKAAHSSVLA